MRNGKGKKPERVYVHEVDERTGALGLVPVYMAHPPQWSEKYLLLFQEHAERLACDPMMTGERLRVYLFVVARCDWENWVRLTYQDMAGAMRIHVEQVGRAMRYLVRRGILVKGPKRWGQCYRLSSRYAFKGALHHLEAYRRREAHRQGA